VQEINVEWMTGSAISDIFSLSTYINEGCCLGVKAIIKLLNLRSGSSQERSCAMAFDSLCLTLFGLIFGILVVFNGYTIFRSLLPLFAAIFGFFLGMQTMFFVFGVGVLSTLTSLIVGVVLSVLFAGLSYAFYRFAIAVLAASLGYAMGVSLMQWIGVGPGFITWLVAVVLGGLFIYLTFKFRLEKYVILVETSLAGSAIILSTLLSGMGTTTVINIVQNPIRELFQYSPLWAILFVGIAAVGILVQIRRQNFKNWTDPLVRDPVREFDPMDFNQ